MRRPYLAESSFREGHGFGARGADRKHAARHRALAPEDLLDHAFAGKISRRRGGGRRRRCGSGNLRERERLPQVRRHRAGVPDPQVVHVYDVGHFVEEMVVQRRDGKTA